MSETFINQSGLKELVEYVMRVGQSQDFRKIEVTNNPTKNSIAIVPNAEGSSQIVDLSKFRLAKPLRKSVDTNLVDIQSFIEYVKEQGTSRTRVFGFLNSSPYRFTAIIDWHGTAEEEADWCEHKVSLILDLSDEFKSWKSRDGKMFSQDAFSEFLKDNRIDIVFPDAADVLQLVMCLDATAESRCKSKLQTNEGYSIQFDETINVSGPLKVPSSIKILIPIFRGTDPIAIECEFKLRIVDSRPQFGIRMIGADRILIEALKKCSETIANKTEKKVFI